jgi:NADP-dependent 3-hydroxy acid dehydrogenase YdfG
MTSTTVALITGGAGGIGAATAELLLDRGCSVVVTGRSPQRLDAFAERCARPDNLLTLPGDAADPATVSDWVQTTLDRFGRLDVAMANAGYAIDGGLADGDPEQWPGMVLTNVLGPALLVHYAADALRGSHGRLILIGSVAGLAPTAANIYGATKYAVTGLAENARRMLTDDGVGVTLIAPGRVETEFWNDLGGPPEMPNLTARQIAEVIDFALTQPAGVDINTLTVRPFSSPV